MRIVFLEEDDRDDDLVEILLVILMAISKDHYDLNSLSVNYWFVLKECKIRFKSQQLVRFVLNWCERGKGFRPDWATKVFDGSELYSYFE